MAFWLGVAEGLQQAQDRQLKREMFLGEKSSKAREKLMDARRIYSKIAMDRQEDIRKEVAQHTSVLKNFEDRLSESNDITREEREAYLGILSNEPGYAISLWDRIEDLEDDEELRLTGRDILEFDDILTELQPDNMSKEQFMNMAIESAFDPNSRVAHYNDMRMRILASEDEEEMVELSMAPDPEGTDFGLGNISDPDPTSFVDPDPADANQFDKIVKDQLTNYANTQYQQLQQEAEAAGLGTTTSLEDMAPEWQEKYNKYRQWAENLTDPQYQAQAYASMWQDPAASASVWANVRAQHPNQFPKFSTMQPSFLNVGQ